MKDLKVQKDKGYRKPIKISPGKCDELFGPAMSQDWGSRIQNELRLLTGFW
ncbi:UNVERIFIED_CONTAM: hypothetical protein FKN15_062276 [Acipenser sinensis]